MGEFQQQIRPDAGRDSKRPTGRFSGELRRRVGLEDRVEDGGIGQKPIQDGLQTTASSSRGLKYQSATSLEEGISILESGEE